MTTDTSLSPSRGRGGFGSQAWDCFKLSPSETITRLASTKKWTPIPRAPCGWSQQQEGESQALSTWCTASSCRKSPEPGMRVGQRRESMWVMPKELSTEGRTRSICPVRLVTAPRPHWLMLIPVSSVLRPGWGELPPGLGAPFGGVGEPLYAPLPLAVARPPRARPGRTRGSGPLAPRDRSRPAIARGPINHRGGRPVGIL